MANKVTKRDNFNAIIEVLNSAGRSDLASVMIHEIELLDRKNTTRSNKPSATQIANEAIKDKIVAVLEVGKQYRCTEIKALIPELGDSVGTQKTAALCNALNHDGRLNKTVEKRIVYYSLA